MVKVITFFLIGMLILALFGRLRWPGGARLPRRTKRADLPKPTRCKTCGKYDVTGGSCRNCSGGQS
ncbi:hypothetical protein ACTYEO_00090 [Rhodophyticola sp. SM2404]